MALRNILNLRAVAVTIALLGIGIYGVISWRANWQDTQKTLVASAYLQAEAETHSIQHWLSALHALGNILALDNTDSPAEADTHIVLFQSAYPNIRIPIFVIQDSNHRVIGSSPVNDTAPQPYLHLAQSTCSGKPLWQTTLSPPTVLVTGKAGSQNPILPACIRIRNSLNSELLDVFALLPWPPPNGINGVLKINRGQKPYLSLDWTGQTNKAGNTRHVSLEPATPRPDIDLKRLIRQIKSSQAPKGWLIFQDHLVAWHQITHYPIVVTAILPKSEVWREWLAHGGAGGGFMLLVVFAIALAISARRASILAIKESRLRHYYGALKDINHTLLKTPEPGQLYDIVCTKLVDGANLPLAWIGTLHGHHVNIHAVAGKAHKYVSDIELDLSENSPSSKGPVGNSITTLQTVYVSDLQQYAGFAFWRGRAARFGLRSVVVTPFQTANGELGVLSAYASQTGFFTPALIQLMEELARDVALGLNQFDHIQEITRLSRQDSLTGLPNRAHFMQVLGQALKRAGHNERLTAIGILDLDYFKQVNDSLGHLVGDQLLRQLAQHLKQAIRHGDTVARLGGDEFGILLEDISGIEELEIIAERLLEHVRRPIPIEGLGHDLQSDGSLGLTIYPLDSGSADDLLRHADAALYAVKGSGRHRWQIFSREMSKMAKREYLIHRKLPHAIEKKELQVHFQPQIDLKNGDVVGAEMLVRWEHPPTGLWLPQSFIPIVEADTRLSRQLGCFLLETAASSIAKWLSKGYPVKRLSVNISARHLQHLAFLEDLDTVLTRFPGTASHLTLEMTETYALANIEQSARTLSAVRARGIQVALDDFGSGYASLQYVRELPLDIIKLDLQFVQNLERDTEAFAIGYAALALAATHGATVVAEGVQNRRTVHLWQRLGGHMVQGYFFARPMPEVAWLSWLRHYHPEPSFSAVPRWLPTLRDLTLLQARPYHYRLMTLFHKAGHDAAWPGTVELHGRQYDWLTPCPLSEWLSARQQPPFKQLDEIHQRLHQVAIQLCSQPATSDANLDAMDAAWQSFEDALDQAIEAVDHELNQGDESRAF